MHQGLKKIAALVCTAAMLTTGIPTATAAIAPPQVLTTAPNFPSDLAGLEVPQTLGTIEEAFLTGGDRTVILIQDAHAVPEAQNSIRKLISYFQKEYGVAAVASEGSTGLTDTFFLRKFPNQELLKKTIRAYHERAELAGVSAAALFDSNVSSRYYGIEDWTLYQEGIRYYQQALQYEPKISTRLKKQRTELDDLKERTYPPKLLDFDQRLYEYQFQGDNLAATLKTANDIIPAPRGSGIEALLLQINAADTTDEKLRQTTQKTIQDFRKNMAGLHKTIPSELNFSIQAFETGEMNAPAVALILKRFASKAKIRVSFAPELARQVRIHKKISQIKGTKLYEGLQGYFKKVKESMLTTPEQKKIDQQSHGIDILEKLARLELTREEWEELKSWKLEVGSGKNQKTSNQNVLSAYKKADKGSTDRLENVRSNSPPFPISNFQPLTLLQDHLSFYKNAEKREGAFLEQLNKLLDTSNAVSSPPHAGSVSENASATVIFVAGGFHSHGLARLLREQNIRYLLLTPKISALPEKSTYREQMMGDVSWKSYFQVEQGRVNLRDAFLRAVRDELLGKGLSPLPQGTVPERSGSSLSTLKLWRDDLIRGLADERRLGDAGSYTRFLDETVGANRSMGSENNFSNPTLIARLNQFIEGLKSLDQTKQLTEFNLFELLKRRSSDVQAQAAFQTESGLVGAKTAQVPAVGGQFSALAELDAASLGLSSRPTLTGAALPARSQPRSELRAMIENGKLTTSAPEGLLEALSLQAVRFKLEKDGLWIVPSVTAEFEKSERAPLTYADHGNFADVYVYPDYHGAVKIMREATLTDESHILHELEVLRELSGSFSDLIQQKNLPQIVAKGKTSGRFYLVTDAPKNARDLDRLRENMSLGFGRRVDILISAASTLEALNAGGWFHGDVKLPNIIVGDKGEGPVQIIDFGLSGLLKGVEPSEKNRDLERFNDLAVSFLVHTQDTPVSREQILRLKERSAWPDVLTFLASLKQRSEVRNGAEASTLSEVLSNYGIQDAQTRLFDDEKKNVWLVTTPEKKWVLKNPLYRTTGELIDWEASVLERLGDRAAQIHKTPTGKNYVTAADGRLYALYEYIEGQEFGWGAVEEADLDHAAQWLARMHRDLKGAELKGRSYSANQRPQLLAVLDLETGFKKLETFLESQQPRGPPQDFQQRISKEDVSLIRRQMAQLREHLTASVVAVLPKTITHGDFHQGNMRFKSSGDIRVFDFEYASEDVRVRDLANALTVRYGLDGSSLSLRKISRFIEAYHAENPLSENEIRVLPDMFRLAYLEGVWLFGVVNGEQPWAVNALREQLLNLERLDAQPWINLQQSLLKERRSEVRVNPEETSEPSDPFEEYRFSVPKNFNLTSVSISRNQVGQYIPQLPIAFKALKKQGLSVRAFGGAVRALAFATRFHFPLPISELDFAVPFEVLMGDQFDQYEAALKDYEALLNDQRLRVRYELDPLIWHPTDEKSFEVILNQKEWSLSKFWTEFDEQRQAFVVWGDQQWFDDVENKRLRIVGESEFSDPERIPRMLKLAHQLQRFGFEVESESLQLFEAEIQGEAYVSGRYQDVRQKALELIDEIKNEQLVQHPEIDLDKSQRLMDQNKQRQNELLSWAFSPTPQNDRDKLQPVLTQHLEIRKESVAEAVFSHEDEGGRYIVYVHQSQPWALKAPKRFAVQGDLEQDLLDAEQGGRDLFAPFFTLTAAEARQLQPLLQEDIAVDSEGGWIAQQVAHSLYVIVGELLQSWRVTDDSRLKADIEEKLKLIFTEWKRIVYRSWALGYVMSDYSLESVGLMNDGQVRFTGESFDNQWTRFYIGAESAAELINNANRQWLQTLFGSKELTDEVYGTGLRTADFDLFWPVHANIEEEEKPAAYEKRKPIFETPEAKEVLIEKFQQDVGVRLQRSEVRAPLQSVSDLFHRAGVLSRDWERTELGLHVSTQRPHFTEMVSAFPDANENPFTVFDAGSGQGVFAIRLAAARPNARILGVESDARLLGDSQKVLAQAVKEGMINSDQIQFFKDDFNSTASREKIAQADYVYYYDSGTQKVKVWADTLSEVMRPGARLVVLSSASGSYFGKNLLETGLFTEEQVPGAIWTHVLMRNDKSFALSEVRAHALSELDFAPQYRQIIAGFQQAGVSEEVIQRMESVMIEILAHQPPFVLRQGKPLLNFFRIFDPALDGRVTRFVSTTGSVYALLSEAFSKKGKDFYGHDNLTALYFASQITDKKMASGEPRYDLLSIGHKIKSEEAGGAVPDAMLYDRELGIYLIAEFRAGHGNLSKLLRQKNRQTLNYLRLLLNVDLEAPVASAETILPQHVMGKNPAGFMWAVDQSVAQGEGWSVESEARNRVQELIDEARGELARDHVPVRNDFNPDDLRIEFLDQRTLYHDDGTLPEVANALALNPEEWAKVSQVLDSLYDKQGFSGFSGIVNTDLYGLAKKLKWQHSDGSELSLEEMYYRYFALGDTLEERLTEIAILTSPSRSEVRQPEVLEADELSRRNFIQILVSVAAGATSQSGIVEAAQALQGGSLLLTPEEAHRLIQAYGAVSPHNFIYRMAIMKEHELERKVFNGLSSAERHKQIEAFWQHFDFAAEELDRERSLAMQTAVNQFLKNKNYIEIPTVLKKIVKKYSEDFEKMKAGFQSEPLWNIFLKSEAPDPQSSKKIYEEAMKQGKRAEPKLDSEDERRETELQKRAELLRAQIKLNEQRVNVVERLTQESQALRKEHLVQLRQKLSQVEGQIALLRAEAEIAQMRNEMGLAARSEVRGGRAFLHQGPLAKASFDSLRNTFEEKEVTSQFRDRLIEVLIEEAGSYFRGERQALFLRRLEKMKSSDFKIYSIPPRRLSSDDYLEGLYDDTHQKLYVSEDYLAILEGQGPEVENYERRLLHEVMYPARKVLVLGASGFIGSEIHNQLSRFYPDVVGTAHTQRADGELIPMDVTREADVLQLIEQEKPDVIVYAAGVADVQTAERDKDRAVLLNAGVPEMLGRYFGGQLVYLSTDYVFDGQKKPYEPSAVPAPLNFYGQTKAQGERAVLAHPQNTVVRFGMAFGAYEAAQRDFIQQLVLQMEGFKQGDAPIVLDDSQIRHPIWTADIAQSVVDAVNEKQSGILQINGDEGMTKFQFAKAVEEAYREAASHYGMGADVPPEGPFWIRAGDSASQASIARPSNAQMVNTAKPTSLSQALQTMVYQYEDLTQKFFYEALLTGDSKRFKVLAATLEKKGIRWAITGNAEKLSDWPSDKPRVYPYEERAQIHEVLKSGFEMTAPSRIRIDRVIDAGILNTPASELQILFTRQFPHPRYGDLYFELSAVSKSRNTNVLNYLLLHGYSESMNAGMGSRKVWVPLQEDGGRGSFREKLQGGSFSSVSRIFHSDGRSVIEKRAKTAEDEGKLLAEARYMRRLQEGLDPAGQWFPTILSIREEADETIVEMEDIPWPNLTEVVQQSFAEKAYDFFPGASSRVVSKKTQMQVLQDIYRLLTPTFYSQVQSSTPPDFIERYHFKKVEQRWQKAAEKSEFVRRLLEAPYLEFSEENQPLMPNLKLMLNVLRRIALAHPEPFTPPYLSKQHGDLHEGNILVDPFSFMASGQLQNIKLIDPKYIPEGNDPLYDFAKLIHNYFGHYDLALDHSNAFHFDIQLPKANRKSAVFSSYFDDEALGTTMMLSRIDMFNKEFMAFLQSAEGDQLFSFEKDPIAWRMRLLFTHATLIAGLLPFHTVGDQHEAKVGILYERSAHLFHMILDGFYAQGLMKDVPGLHSAWKAQSKARGQNKRPAFEKALKKIDTVVTDSRRSEVRMGEQPGQDGFLMNKRIRELLDALKTDLIGDQQSTVKQYVDALELLFEIGVLKGNLVYPGAGVDVFPALFAEHLAALDSVIPETGLSVGGQEKDLLELLGLNLAGAAGIEFAKMLPLPIDSKGRVDDAGELLKNLSWKLSDARRERAKTARPQILRADHYQTKDYFPQLREIFGGGDRPVNALLIKGLHYGIDQGFLQPGTPEAEGEQRKAQELIRDYDRDLMAEEGFVILMGQQELYLADFLAGLGYRDYLASLKQPEIEETLAVDAPVTISHVDRAHDHFTSLRVGRLPVMVFQRPKEDVSSAEGLRSEVRSQERASSELKEVSPVADILREQIRVKGGAITFRDFMETSLYEPHHGYYTGGNVSLGGHDAFHDFSTYVESSSELFAEGLLNQMLVMWEKLGQPKKLQIVEMGAGQGVLASHVLRTVKATLSQIASDKSVSRENQKLRSFLKSLDYVIVEISDDLKRRQREEIGRVMTEPAVTEDGMSDDQVSVSWAPFAAHQITGSAIAGKTNPLTISMPRIFISNELPDAFPVHRVKARVAKSGLLEYLEAFVTTDASGRFVEIWQPLDALNAVRIEMAIQGMGKVYENRLKAGGEVAVNLQALEWQGRLAKLLNRSPKDRGYIVTIDYGYPGTQYIPDNKMSVRSYAKGRPFIFLGVKIQNPALLQNIHLAMGMMERIIKFFPPRLTRLLYRMNPMNLFVPDDHYIYEKPGHTDITSDVDFSMLDDLGERLGLATEALVSQGHFFALTGLSPEKANPLDHPGFFTLVQSKGVKQALFDNQSSKPPVWGQPKPEVQRSEVRSPVEVTEIINAGWTQDQVAAAFSAFVPADKIRSDGSIAPIAFDNPAETEGKSYLDYGLSDSEMNSEWFQDVHKLRGDAFWQSVAEQSFVQGVLPASWDEIPVIETILDPLILQLPYEMQGSNSVFYYSRILNEHGEAIPVLIKTASDRAQAEDDLVDEALADFLLKRFGFSTILGVVNLKTSQSEMLRKGIVYKIIPAVGLEENYALFPRRVLANQFGWFPEMLKTRFGAAFYDLGNSVSNHGEQIALQKAIAAYNKAYKAQRELPETPQDEPGTVRSEVPLDRSPETPQDEPGTVRSEVRTEEGLQLAMQRVTESLNQLLAQGMYRGATEALKDVMLISLFLKKNSPGVFSKMDQQRFMNHFFSLVTALEEPRSQRDGFVLEAVEHINLVFKEQGRMLFYSSLPARQEKPSFHLLNWEAIQRQANDIANQLTLRVPGQLKSIMVAEDLLIPEYEFWAKELQEKWGVQLIVKPNGREGLEELTQNASDYDLIISDINMPDMTGPEMMNAYANLSQQKQETPAIIVTDVNIEALQPERDKGYDYGFPPIQNWTNRAYLEKPAAYFDAYTLPVLSEVVKLLRSRSEMRVSERQQASAVLAAKGLVAAMETGDISRSEVRQAVTLTVEIGAEPVVAELERIRDELAARAVRGETVLIAGQRVDAALVQNQAQSMIDALTQERTGHVSMGQAVTYLVPEDEAGALALARVIEKFASRVTQVLLKKEAGQKIPPTFLDKMKELGIQVGFVSSLTKAPMLLTDQVYSGLVGSEALVPEQGIAEEFVPVVETQGEVSSTDPLIRELELALQTAIALLVAEKIRKVSDKGTLHAQAVALLKDYELFAGFESRVIVAREGGITISGSAIESFLASWAARQQVQTAA